ncbi:FGGY-family carbohydrate kinase [Leptolyngbya sp. NIES-2104]|uniref:FGGY-family carbohydrate kinase n=1 Tax=Leptolyngbya sp. NIES-2104 TaxID=1552121 RepID=UPI0006ECA873|nr:FGGY-family carbohydrate kinase [Leptolyngbya sp. NIES-2104]GAP98664.1 carbohydrate kinase, FGGY family [Leptolyngbya sp. NIES-2104]
MDLFLGIDFGTSGARAIAIHSNGDLVAQTSVKASQHWDQMLWQLLEALSIEVRSRLARIAINGTSSTVLLCDRAGVPITEPLMYNDARGASVLDQIRNIAPEQHTVISATSSLAKLLWWQSNCELFSKAQYFLHQADWLAFLLHGQLGMSDYHNSLKLGYDVERFEYPDWLPLRELLPIVVEPGSAIAPIQSAIAQRFNIPLTCQICAGTTDSIAAFIASEAKESGDAVTSLGSTLVLKLLSETRIDRSEFGIYSHRYKDRWLVGGASNTGGAVLEHFFTSNELRELSDRIPDRESPLDYYPLLQPGDRFPINDPTLAPRLEPRPGDRVEFLHGLLESMARIEAQGYRLLESFGATPLKRVLTAGGGAKNQAWTAIRQRHLGVSVQSATQTEAAYGTALLAMRGLI